MSSDQSGTVFVSNDLFFKNKALIYKIEIMALNQFESEKNRKAKKQTS